MINRGRKHYQRQCEGKRGFSTPEKAQQEIGRSHPQVSCMNIYFCPWCRFWHIGRDQRKGA